jgi:hypothetical protein
MTHTINTLANYLDRPASVMLAEPPFKNWDYERSIDTDLEEIRIDYVFAQNGVDFICDVNDEIRTIFLYFDEDRQFVEGLQDLPFTFTRKKVLDRLGVPSKSSKGFIDPILGVAGPWDRFTRNGFVIHVEYHPSADTIIKITLMRPDVVP